MLRTRKDPGGDACIDQKPTAPICIGAGIFMPHFSAQKQAEMDCLLVLRTRKDPGGDACIDQKPTAPICIGAGIFMPHFSAQKQAFVEKWGIKKPRINSGLVFGRCGEGGIRTPGTLRHAGFQDRCIRPLCHFSAGKSKPLFHSAKTASQFFAFFS